MRPKFKRFVAALVGAVTLLAPATAFADDDEYCKTYAQVESDSGGGQYVGGLLIYETTAEFQRTYSEPSVTTSTSSSAQVGIPGSMSTGTTTTVSVTQDGKTTTVTAEEPVGYYKMNDGSVYQINCLSGQGTPI